MEALSRFLTAPFDLVLLDVMLPKIDGFAVCELIRKQSCIPIIMLTALSGEEEQIRGLDLQIDDYITKPFSMPILIRKIAAVLRRSGNIAQSAVAGLGETSPVLSNQYYFSFFDSSDRYTLVVYGEAEHTSG